MVNFVFMEKTNWKVEGMTCSNCSLTVTKFLEKQGKQNVKVNLISGDVIFDTDGHDHDHLIKGIEELGYTVKAANNTSSQPKKKLFKTHLQRFLFCAVFTLPLMLHVRFMGSYPLDYESLGSTLPFVYRFI